MSTWHQAHNLAAITALWEPHPTHWKCVTDHPNKFASTITFATEAEARAYAERTGDIVIAPRKQP